jgi:hypothetical protein
MEDWREGGIKIVKVGGNPGTTVEISALSSSHFRV